jgi:hypothetical protein
MKLHSCSTRNPRDMLGNIVSCHYLPNFSVPSYLFSAAIIPNHEINKEIFDLMTKEYACHEGVVTLCLYFMAPTAQYYNSKSVIKHGFEKVLILKLDP